jgi:ACS family glucarate transporter-like MFS transporter
MNGVPAVSTGSLTTEPERPTSVRWRILALLFAYSFMSWFNRISMSVAGNEYLMEHYHIDKPDMGMVYSALLFSYTICMTPGGWLIDRFGPWVALVIMGLGSALFGALTGMLGWFLFGGTALWAGLLIIRGLMGIFTAPIYPASGRIVANWFPFPQRAWASGLVIGAALVGNASAFFGFGSLIDFLGWEMAFVITGAITALVTLVWVLYGRNLPAQHPSVNAAEQQIIMSGKAESPPPGARSAAKTRWDEWLFLLRNRSLVWLTVSYAAVGYFEYLFYFWIEHYFENELGLDKTDSRLAATIANLSMSVGIFGGGWLADWCMRRFGYRLGRAFVPVVGMLASAFFLLLGLLATEPEWIVAWFSLAMASVGSCEGPMWATAIELGGKHGGTSAGIFNTGGNAGGVLSPYVTPLVGKYFGWKAGISLGAVVCLIGVVLWFWIDPKERCPDYR